METKKDLKVFRKEAATWIEENCPPSMREPVVNYNDLYWGGKKQEGVTEDHMAWFNRCYEKGCFIGAIYHFMEL